jgi:hypothetical protein
MTALTPASGENEDHHSGALDNLLAVLDLAASEPDDGIAVLTHFDASVQRQGLTWGELREIATDVRQLAPNATLHVPTPSKPRTNARTPSCCATATATTRTTSCATLRTPGALARNSSASGTTPGRHCSASLTHLPASG